jgi:hypothetical protein
VQAGDFDAAIAGWTALLDDGAARAFFAEGGEEGEEDGPLREIAADLAEAYLRKGDDESRARARQLVDQWGLELVAEGGGAAETSTDD